MMAENTKIEWATHTFNPWIGCSKVHAGCDNCYAAAMAGRLGVKWGPNGTRRRTADSTWKQVEKWNRKAGLHIIAAQAALSNFRGGLANPLPGEIERIKEELLRPRVFPSLCDPFEVFDGSVIAGLVTLDDFRRDFFALIDRCQNLDFLLLTKRPENARRILTDTPPTGEYKLDDRGRCDGPAWYRRNVWILYSASDQKTLEADLPHLLACRDLVPVLGLSLEPLIAPVDLRAALSSANVESLPIGIRPRGPFVDFIIIGGESGPHFRPMKIEWLESIAEQCKSAGVPLFVKQDSGRKPGQQGRIPDRLWARKELPKYEQ